MFKKKLFMATLAVLAPMLAFAQSSAITRAQVHGELVEFEQAGYKPVADQAQYPLDVEAAQPRMQPSQAATTSYGPDTYGSSESLTRSGVAPSVNANPIDYSRP
jgi:hypothetical protein